MKERCLNCGGQVTVTRLKHDENNIEGFYISCPNCGASFDIDADRIKELMFIDDIAKMADFKVLTEKEFLETYSYISQDEYDATLLYFDWLNADDSEP